MAVTDAPHVRQATLTREKLPACVYHYTSTDGLLGIIGSGQLRATDLRYLNDTSELHYGLTEMLRAYEIMSHAPRDGYSASDRLAKLYGIGDDIWKPIGKLEFKSASNLPLDLFAPIANAIVGSLQDGIVVGVACFCADGDLLSQWRGYGIDGFALGFDAQVLRKLVEERYLPLTPVVYGRPQEVRTNLRAVFSEVERILKNEAMQQPASIRNSVTLPLLRQAAQVKHPAFDSEIELRLGDVASDSGSWWFRGGRLGVIPYINIDLRREVEPGKRLMPLREVRLAPGPESALRENAVRALLGSKGYSVASGRSRGGVCVSSSAIPFRG